MRWSMPFAKGLTLSPKAYMLELENSAMMFRKSVQFAICPRLMITYLKATAQIVFFFWSLMF